MNLLIEKSISFNERVIYLSLFHLHKSYLLLISDQAEMGIGNVTLSSPPTIEGLKSISVSYNLFGMKEKLLSKIIAEKCSKMLKAPVLSLLFIKNVENEEKLVKPIINFLNSILEELVLENNIK